MCVLIFLNDPRWKKMQRKSKEEIRAKSDQKQSANRAKTGVCEISQPKRSRCGINVSLRKRSSFAKSFRNSIESSAKIFVAAKPSLAHDCHFAAQEPPFHSCKTAAKLQSMKIPNFAAKAPFRRVFCSCKTDFGTQVPLRSTVTPILQLRNGLQK